MAILKKKKCKKAKWLSEEDLQIAVKRSEKTKEKRKKIHPSEYRVLKNSKRDKKAFLSVSMQRNRGKQ